MRKWKYTPGCEDDKGVFTEWEGVAIEAESDTEFYVASEVDARLAELEGYNAEHQSLAGLQDIRIKQLEKALHQIKNGLVDADDEQNELWRLSPSELRKIASEALGL